MARDQKQEIVVFKGELSGVSDYIKRVLPNKANFERFEQMAVLAVLRDPNLLLANRRSLLLAILWCAQRDLEPGVDDGAALVPFKGKVTPIPYYRGLIKKAVGSGAIKEVDAKVVYEHDEFKEVGGLMPDLQHTPTPLEKEPGKWVGVYVVFTMPDGMKKFHVMRRKEVEKIKKSSAAALSGPWIEWEEKMALKSCIKQAMKLIISSPEVRDLINDDMRIESGESVAKLLEESAVETGLMPEDEKPEVLKEPPPEKAKSLLFDERKFNELVARMDVPDNYDPEEMPAHVEQFVEATAKAQKRAKVAPNQVKMRAIEHWDAFKDAFYKWLRANIPPMPEVEDQGEPLNTESETNPDIIFAERQTQVWHEIVSKGVSIDLLAEHGVVKRADITQENIEEIEEVVKNFKPSKKGGK